MNRKKVLITGSCGFVLGNLIRKAIYEKQPYQFVSLDRVGVNAANSMYWNKNHTFHIADIRDAHIIDVVFQFEKPDIVIHGAAETTDSKNYLTSNVIGTQNLLDACVKHGVERMIYISTSEVYGAMPSDEDAAVNPLNKYAASKAAGELLVKSAANESALKYNIVRMSNAYGPRQSSDNFVPTIVKNILQNKEFGLVNGGLIERDWTHVFDHCAGILAVLNSGAPNETYNVSSKQEFTDIEVAYLICKAMTKGHNLIVKDSNENALSSTGSNGLSSGKIRGIGWEPRYKFKNGVIDTIEWYNNNQWFLK